METDKKKIKEELDRILTSNVFSNSEKYKELLVYLIESSLKGENPKEFKIGLEVFHRNIEDASSSSVRVYVFKLRKKLDEYYRTEGKSDKLRFSIPKGTYKINVNKKTSFFNKKHRKHLITALLITGLMGINILVYLFLSPPKTENQLLGESKFWQDLTNNDKNTIIIAGDYFIFRNTKKDAIDKRYQLIRDIRINNFKQLEEYLADSKEYALENVEIPSGVSYLQRDALFSMQYIIPLLETNKIDYQIILSSEFNWNLFKDYNIIYIGSFKNLNDLGIIVSRLQVHFDEKNLTLISTSNSETTNYRSAYKKDKNSDPTLVSKIPGPNNNVIYFFTSNHDIGCISTLKYFTHLDSLKKFEKQKLQNDDYFKSLFIAEGIERTNMSLDLFEFEALSDSAINQMWH